jgi:hypothetical protein
VAEGAALSFEAGSFFFAFVRLPLRFLRVWRRPPPVLRTYSPKALPRFGGEVLVTILALSVLRGFAHTDACRNAARSPVVGNFESPCLVPR